MNPWRWVDPRVQSVRVADLKKYLLGRGWKRRRSANPNFMIFEEPAGHGEPITQAVPASEDFADYLQRITETITTLSEIEDRHPVELLDVILGHGTGDQAQKPTVNSERPTRRSRPA
jgi:hypothetical protein